MSEAKNGTYIFYNNLTFFLCLKVRFTTVKVNKFYFIIVFDNELHLVDRSLVYCLVIVIKIIFTISLLIIKEILSKKGENSIIFNENCNFEEFDFIYFIIDRYSENIKD